MSGKCWYKVAMIVFICGALSSGCRTRGRGPGGDILKPEELPGDIALGERFEDGTRVTNVKFSNVHFAYDSFQIMESELSKIEKVAGYMRRNRDVRLVTEGHCDERGSREYNISLGEHRALAVRAHLVGLGIAASNVQTKSYGEEMPFDAGHNESAWRLNRRAEFVFYR